MRSYMLSFLFLFLSHFPPLLLPEQRGAYSEQGDACLELSRTAAIQEHTRMAQKSSDWEEGRFYDKDPPSCIYNLMDDEFPSVTRLRKRIRRPVLAH